MSTTTSTLLYEMVCDTCGVTASYRQSGPPGWFRGPGVALVPVDGRMPGERHWCPVCAAVLGFPPTA